MISKGGGWGESCRMGFHGVLPTDHSELLAECAQTLEALQRTTRASKQPPSKQKSRPNMRYSIVMMLAALSVTDP